jgi:PGF-pre-PGF domain-containing protein
MYWGIKLNRLIILLAAFFLLTLGSGIGAAAEIYVQPGDSIQTAVDNAISGDIIILKPGTYTENIEINKDDLLISSESGNPDDTIITARSSSNHVITLQADYVKISGLGITGTKESYTGIYLSGCNNCIIENNKILKNGYGIYLLNSKGNTLSNNKVTNNGEYGILFSSATDNILSGNTASDNKGRGIHIGTSDGNTLSGNTISSNGIYGLFVCPKSDNNLIYNNYFNNAVNAEIKNGIGNAYNTVKTEGVNIVGGPYLGGNFWAEPEGTDFSETAVDADGDGIADSEYRLSNSIYSDELPLISTSKPQQPILPVANFEMDDNNGPAPLSVLFTDLSENAVSWNWDFESDGNIDSTEENPIYVFTTPGTYTVTLSVTNENGEASKTGTVTVTQPVENDSANNVTENNNIGENAASTNGSDDSGTGDSETGNETIGNAEEDLTGNNGTEGNSENNAAENGETGGDGTENSHTEDSSGSSGSSRRSSGGGGSSGGSGGSPEPARNVEAKEISQTFITADKKIKFDLRNNATCVVYVTFDAKKTVGKTTTIVEVLKTKSSLVSEPLSDEIYRYFNIWVGNGGYATSKNIENPVVCFKVEKDWIENKSINKTSISLNRYDAGKWEQLPVSLSEEDDRFLYFTAETSGFSFFAITGKVEAKEIPVANSELDSQPGSEATNLNSAINSSSVKSALEKRASERSPGFEAIFGVISLIVLFLYKKRT